MAQSVSLEIPDKLYFKIGEVGDIVGVKPYVLRYWETEFGDITPVKSRTNQRLYKRRDVELLLNIKDLLYHQNFTINGARKRLKDMNKERRRQVQDNDQLSLGLATAVEIQPTNSVNVSACMTVLEAVQREMEALLKL